MEDIMKMLKSLEEPSLLKNGVTKIIENEKNGFIGMLLGTLGANLLGNMLVGKAKILGWGIMREDKEEIRPRQNF